MRRPRGSGSITRLEDKPNGRCRKWLLRYKGRSRTFHGTYAQANAALEAFRAEVDDAAGCTGSPTFRTYADAWARRRELSGEYRDSTNEKVRNAIAALDVVFGDVEMRDLTRPVVADGFARLRGGDNPSGRKLSGSYAQSLWTVLKQVVLSARLDGLVEGDPFLGLKAPKVTPTGRRALDTGELLAFVARLDSEPHDAHTIALRLALMCGMRRGEVCGLRWCDLDGDSIHVRRSVDELGNAVPTKTASSVRKVPLSDGLVQVLSEWHHDQRMLLAANGVEQTDATPICATIVGTHMHPQNLERWWRANRASYGLDGVVLHELRHTFLTYLAHASKDMSAVQHIAGWSSPEMARVYVHGSDDAERAAVDSLGW